jgi:L-lactate dehydrogenase (cytochrome)
VTPFTKESKNISMKFQYNPKYPSVEDLIKKAKSRIQLFAFEYLDGVCNYELNLYKYSSEISEVV